LPLANFWPAFRRKVKVFASSLAVQLSARSPVRREGLSFGVVVSFW
jgi:hypothetical protein